MAAADHLPNAWRPTVLDGLRLSLDANNLFSKEPPPCLTCSLNGYDASTYDLHGGGFWYVRADLQF